MTSVTNDALVITIKDGSAEERRVWLIKSIASMLNYYVLSNDKRKADGENAAVLLDLMQELADIEDD